MSESLPRPLGRPCVTCTHSRRAEVEQAIVSDERLSVVSAEFEIEVSSLRRHRQRHMLLGVEEARVAGLDSATVFLRLAEIEARLREDAEEAQAQARVADHARASDAQRRVLATIAALGLFSHETLAADVQRAHTELRALGRVMRKNPEVAEAVAAELEAADELALADDMRARILMAKTKAITS